MNLNRCFPFFGLFALLAPTIWYLETGQTEWALTDNWLEHTRRIGAWQHMETIRNVP